MAKPKTEFLTAFEPILIKAWGSYQDHFDAHLLKKTREAISSVRRVYRFKGERGAESPSRIDYKKPENRAGYLGAFGERHAYLSYAHLKKVEDIKPDSVPLPNKNGELTVTTIGAGPAIETYGLCLFYNETAHKLKRLNLNLVEKVREWQPARDLVISDLIKAAFPKMDVYGHPIDADIKEENCLQTFAANHDALISTDILLIYNVLNEIEAEYAPKVLRNLSYIIRQCEQPLLVLLAEPTASNAWPRIRWLRDLLMQHCSVIIDEPKKTIDFSDNPIKISMTGINEDLFSKSIDKNAPEFLTSLERVMMACQMIPPDLFEDQRYEQLRKLKLKRDHKGRILDSPVVAEQHQLPLFPS